MNAMQTTEEAPRKQVDGLGFLFDFIFSSFFCFLLLFNLMHDVDLTFTANFAVFF